MFEATYYSNGTDEEYSISRDSFGNLIIRAPTEHINAARDLLSTMHWKNRFQSSKSMNSYLIDGCVVEDVLRHDSLRAYELRVVAETRGGLASLVNALGFKEPQVSLIKVES